MPTITIDIHQYAWYIRRVETGTEQPKLSPAHLPPASEDRNVSRRVWPLCAHLGRTPGRCARPGIYCRTSQAAAHRGRDTRWNSAWSIRIKAAVADCIRQAILILAQCQHGHGFPLSAWPDPLDVLLWSRDPASAGQGKPPQHLAVAHCLRPGQFHTGAGPGFRGSAASALADRNCWTADLCPSHRG